MKGSEFIPIAKILLLLVVVAVVDGSFGIIERISLGVVMQPGRVISTADTDHIAQEFVLTIPEAVEIPRTLNITDKCVKALVSHNRQHNNTRSLLEKSCGTMSIQENWVNQVIEKLTEERKQIVKKFSKIK